MDQILYCGSLEFKSPSRNLLMLILTVDDLPWFDTYAGQSVGQLLSLKGKYRIDSLVTTIANQLALRQGPNGSIPKYSAQEWTVLVVQALETSVNGDGFEGFFADNAIYAAKVVESFKAIGCPKMAAIVQKAVVKLKVNNLADVEAVEEASHENFDLLDKKFYEYPENPKKHFLNTSPSTLIPSVCP